MKLTVTLDLDVGKAADLERLKVTHPHLSEAELIAYCIMWASMREADDTDRPYED